MNKKLLNRLLREEKGQAVVLFALLLVVLLGITSFTVDVGYLQWQKRELQNTADAAALAAAQDLPDASVAVATAEDYALAHGVTIAETTVNTPYNGDSYKVEVISTRDVPRLFSRIWGNTDIAVSARAVVAKQLEWAGNSLPFMNFDYNYATDPPVTVWTHVGSGVKGTISDFRTHGSGSDTFFEVEWEDGITFQKGFKLGEKGLDFSKLKDGIELVLTEDDQGEKIVYVFSLRSDIIENREFTVNGGDVVSLDELSKLKDGDVIDRHQLVLIKCLYMTSNLDSNNTQIELKYLGEVFTLGNVYPNHLNYPELPYEDFQSTVGSPRMTE